MKLTTAALAMACIAAAPSVLAKDPPKSLQIGVTKKAISCPVKSQSGDKLAM